MLSLVMTRRHDILGGGLMYRIAVVSGLNCTCYGCLFSLVHFSFPSMHKPDSMEHSKFNTH